jgi:phenylacetate-coenzyme A ligase PaaK-like adenylate-forming protein
MTVTKRYAELRAQHRSDFERQFPQLLEQTRWSAERLRDQREARLRELLHVAVERSSWHASRLAGVSPASFQLDDLSHLPPMSKRDLMANFDAIACDPRITLAGANEHVEGLVEGAYLFDRYQVIASGGSSGLRGVFVYDWDAWVQIAGIATRWAVREVLAD